MYKAGILNKIVGGLISAVKIFICVEFEAKEVEPLLEVLTSLLDLVSAHSFATLNTAVDDVDSGGEGSCHIVVQINSIWHKEASRDIVDTGLGVLRRHIEPETGLHGNSSIIRHLLWVLKELQLAVIG